MVLIPLIWQVRTLMWFFEYVICTEFKCLKEYFRVKFIKALYEKIMKAITRQDMKWTRLQMSQGPKHEAVKLQGPK
jgi:hypothetical protein